jgi:hypothetical protein
MNVKYLPCQNNMMCRLVAIGGEVSTFSANVRVLNKQWLKANYRPFFHFSFPQIYLRVYEEVSELILVFYGQLTAHILQECNTFK